MFNKENELGFAHQISQHEDVHTLYRALSVMEKKYPGFWIFKSQNDHGNFSLDLGVPKKAEKTGHEEFLTVYNEMSELNRLETLIKRSGVPTEDERMKEWIKSHQLLIEKYFQKK